jgi:hypothetical protein
MFSLEYYYICNAPLVNKTILLTLYLPEEKSLNSKTVVHYKYNKIPS